MVIWALTSNQIRSCGLVVMTSALHVLATGDRRRGSQVRSLPRSSLFGFLSFFVNEKSPLFAVGNIVRLFFQPEVPCEASVA